ncbi:hypothetical protein [Nitrosophilus kaiyonis]|uniref:hypothetical protein n=1 Tax=Nitrosophilus kaiyonis TaxID=2930200 RepID=UPI002490C2DF|nr:hypothetical protein [Nitrosophilus kaiyonis]
MLRKVVLSIGLAALLMAAEIVVLPNGKTALIKPDGTWEDVTLAKMGGKTIALKKDGTWVEVTGQLKTLKPAVQSEQIGVEGGNTEFVKPQKSALPEFAKALIGHWSTDDGSLQYIFKDNFKMTLIKDGEKEDMDFTVAGYDEEKRIIRIGLGKRFKIGPASFGGKIIKLRLSEDGTKLYDLTNSIEEMKEIKLKKISQAKNLQFQEVEKKPESEKKEEGFFDRWKNKVKSWVE